MKTQEEKLLEEIKASEIASAINFFNAVQKIQHDHYANPVTNEAPLQKLKRLTNYENN